MQAALHTFCSTLIGVCQCDPGDSKTKQLAMGHAISCHGKMSDDVSFVACELTAASTMSGASAKSRDAFQDYLGAPFLLGFFRC